MNPLPQFTDCRYRSGTLTSSSGMGEIYSEEFDDAQYRVVFSLVCRSLTRLQPLVVAHTTLRLLHWLTGVNLVAGCIR